MIEDILFWLRFKLPYYIQLSILNLFHKIDIEQYALTIFMTKRYDSLKDRIEVKEAMKANDFKKVRQITSKMKLDKCFHEDECNKFLHTIKTTTVIILILIPLLILFLAMIIL